MWNNFDEVEISGVGKKWERTSTSHLRKYVENCLFIMRVYMTKEKKQPVILFKYSNPSNLFLILGVKFSNERIRKIIAIIVIVHEQLLNIVEEEVWMWAIQYANPDFHKGGNFEREFYFVKVPSPRHEIDVANTIFKCLKTKCFFYVLIMLLNSCLRNLNIEHKSNNGHTLNFLVQYDLGKIKDVIHNICESVCIYESVKYINYNDSRLKAFGDDIFEQKNIKETNFIIDYSIRKNLTFQMLLATLKFKITFLAYKEREPHCIYIYAHSHKVWEKYRKFAKLLEVYKYNLRTTTNLYLVEVWMVRQVIDNALNDKYFFKRAMTALMKVIFEKYWEECNLLMAITNEPCKAD
ncbi:Zinc finger BED domain-containing protein RICESLEEPER 2, partial [Mucuna pruriens]